MRWLAKALLQKSLSALPQAERANYVLQRHVTRSLPSGFVAMSAVVAGSRELMELVKKHSPRPVDAAVFLELGAGAELAGPPVFRALAAQRQIVVDVTKMAEMRVVSATVRRLIELGVLEEARDEVGRSRGMSLEQWLREAFGIELGGGGWVACPITNNRQPPGHVGKPGDGRNKQIVPFAGHHRTD